MTSCGNRGYGGTGYMYSHRPLSDTHLGVTLSTSSERKTGTGTATDSEGCSTRWGYMYPLYPHYPHNPSPAAGANGPSTGQRGDNTAPAPKPGPILTCAGCGQAMPHGDLNGDGHHPNCGGNDTPVDMAAFVATLDLPLQGETGPCAGCGATTTRYGPRGRTHRHHCRKVATA